MMEISHLYSLESLKHTFKIDTVNNVVPVMISFDPNKYVQSSSPGVTLADNITMDGKFVTVLFPFPTKANMAPGTCTEVNNKNIYQLPQKKLVTGHKVKEIDVFNKNGISDIGRYVAENGAITFILTNLLGATDFFVGIPDLCSRYKYSAFFYHYVGCPVDSIDKKDYLNKEVNDSKFIPFISFVDIHYCIPIFNHCKVDGIGVYCGFMYKENMVVSTLCFVMSNYKENLLYVDGIRIYNATAVDPGALEYMLQYISADANDRNSKPCLPTKGLRVEDVNVVAQPNFIALRYNGADTNKIEFSTSTTSTWR